MIILSAEFEKELGTKGFDDIVSDTLDSIVQKDVGLTNTNPGSVIRTLVEVLAENEDTQNYYLEYVYRCMDIDNCVGEDIDRSVKILGLTRNPAKQAVGEVTFYTGDSPAEFDIEIPYGYIVSTRPDKNGDVVEFTVQDNNLILPAGQSSITATVLCTVAKQININKGAISILTQSLQGINSVVNEYEINGGSDIESDESFKARIGDVRESYGKCTDEALEAAVNQVSGVTRCSVSDQYNGVGTTAIIVVTDQVPAPQSVKDAIQLVVSATKASGVKADIVYTNIKSVDIDINVTNITSDNYSTIVNAINTYCNALVSGQSFIVKQMERKVLNAIDKTTAENDDYDITTFSPEGNITATEEQIIRPATIKINGTLV